MNKPYELLESLDTYKEQGYNLYNVAGGSTGATSSYEHSGYGRRDLHEKVKTLLSHGFNSVEIAKYLGVPTHSAGEIIKVATGMDNRPARLYYSGQKMLELIDDGVFDLDELASNFRGMDANDVFVTLASEDFPLGNEYLKGWLTAKYLKLGGERGSFEKYLRDLGFKLSSLDSGTFYKFRKRMNLYGHYDSKDYIPLLRFYATVVIKDFDTIYGFIHHMGLYEDSMYAWERETLVVDLFGFDFDTAQDIYHDHYFGHLKIIIH